MHLKKFTNLKNKKVQQKSKNLNKKEKGKEKKEKEKEKIKKEQNPAQKSTEKKNWSQKNARRKATTATVLKRAVALGRRGVCWLVNYIITGTYGVE